MSVLVWETGVAKPWQNFNGGTVVNYATAQEQITEEELMEILDKVTANQGLLVIHDNKLRDILICLDELKKQSQEAKKLYSAITDLKRALLRGDSNELRGNDNATR